VSSLAHKRKKTTRKLFEWFCHTGKRIEMSATISHPVASQPNYFGREN